MKRLEPRRRICGSTVVFNTTALVAQTTADARASANDLMRQRERVFNLVFNVQQD